MKVNCPGHKEGTKCKFCKREEGYIRKVGGLTIIDRLTKRPTIDPCCKQCANNMAYAKKKFSHPDIAARFRSNIPKSDEL